MSRDRIQPRVSRVVRIFEVPPVLPARTAFCSLPDAFVPQIIEVMMETPKSVSQDRSQQHAPRVEQTTEVRDLPAKTHFVTISAQVLVPEPLLKRWLK